MEHTRECKKCGCEFKTTHPRKVFCITKCRTSYFDERSATKTNIKKELGNEAYKKNPSFVELPCTNADKTKKVFLREFQTMKDGAITRIMFKYLKINLDKLDQKVMRSDGIQKTIKSCVVSLQDIEEVIKMYNERLSLKYSSQSINSRRLWVIRWNRLRIYLEGLECAN